MALLLICLYSHVAQSLTGRKDPDRSVKVPSFIRPCAEQKHLRLMISPILYVSLSFSPSVDSGESVRSVCTELSSCPCPDRIFCRMPHWRQLRSAEPH